MCRSFLFHDSAIAYKCPRSLFPKLNHSFKAYRGLVVNIDEWGSREGFEECRNEIGQLDLANYFDKKLCKRALDLTPPQVASRLRGNVELVEATKDGVLIIATRKIVDIPRARQLGQSLTKLLKK